MAFILPKGKLIDTDTFEMAMEDADGEHQYFLNIQTGEVAFSSEFDDGFDEEESSAEDYEGEEYIPVERVHSYEAYQWMEDFVEQVVAPKDRQAAEKLSIALMGKGAFRRFKDVLNRVDDKWAQEWYQYKDKQLYEAMREWFASLSVTITEQ